MGAQQTTNLDPNETGVSFVIGADNVHVYILRPEDLAERTAVIDALLSLSTSRNLYRLVYLAAPRVLGTSIDASAFRARGIGLLFFDDRRIDESLAAQSVPETVLPTASAAKENDLAEELASLKSMYHAMEQTLNQLRDDLANIRTTPSQHLGPPRRQEPLAGITPQTILANNLPAHIGLPSYFANNPWLDVLSKRGNGEHEAIAG
jgi:hypothetical protein